MAEIGSEFWAPDVRRKTQVFLSGRTALDFIIRDILAQEKVQRALLPSYCCHTMIEPFLRNGLAVRFYDVFPNEKGLTGALPDARDGEVLLVMSYFGYSCLQDLYLEDMRRWKWVIEDRTHSWLSSDKPMGADYEFVSYRKWTGLSGVASAHKRKGAFTIRPELRYNEPFVRLRRSARECKARYLADGTGGKTRYLELFSQAEELLDREYRDCQPTLEDLQALLDLDVERIRAQRGHNARLLVQELRDIPGLDLVFPEPGEGDAPLCVPVLVEESKRDALRKQLIGADIYCPVHWPLSELHEGISVRGKEIYGRELSLICDQRYEEEDMARECKVIRDFFERNE